jgi:glutamate racemase
MIHSNIDFLVLGCSHYPYLIPQIEKILPKTIQIIDSGEAVARQTKNILEKNQLLNTASKKSKNIFYTNASSAVLSNILEEKYTVLEKDF